MTGRETALLCADCGWILAAMPAKVAAEVPRCLACGSGALVRQEVAAGVRLTRWPGPETGPGWAVYSKPALDRRLALAESRN